jgi:hypothetical protein
MDTFSGHFVRPDNKYPDCSLTPAPFSRRVKDGTVDIIPNNINLVGKIILEEFTDMGRVGNLNSRQPVDPFYPGFLLLRKTGGKGLIAPAIVDANPFF